MKLINDLINIEMPTAYVPKLTVDKETIELWIKNIEDRLEHVEPSSDEDIGLLCDIDELTDLLYVMNERNLTTTTFYLQG